ncbi:MAG: cytochrome b/b6 domain-containing protein [Herminiimonas sp.]|nr:cytochrome b/b6 domain-containing protein [Herminiimonas sp.]
MAFSHYRRPVVMKTQSVLINPLWMRLTHWVNAIAVIIMILSGWRIYNASPIFAFRIPAELTMGGWLGGALQWHFAAMWLLVLNGVAYLMLNVATGRFRRKLLPVSVTGFIEDAKAALTGHLTHDDISKYNTVQKVAYLAIILDLVLLVLSGIAVWKSVQFPLLRELMGGFDNARVVHFFAMAFAVAFLIVHLVMVALVPRTLVAMVRGR